MPTREPAVPEDASRAERELSESSRPVLASTAARLRSLGPFARRCGSKRARAAGKEDPARLGERFGAMPRAAPARNAGVAARRQHRRMRRGARSDRSAGRARSFAVVSRHHRHAHVGRTRRHAARRRARPMFTPRSIGAMPCGASSTTGDPTSASSSRASFGRTSSSKRKRAGVPLALVNARMSPKSLRPLGALAASGARELMSAFALTLAADARTARRAHAPAGREHAGARQSEARRAAAAFRCGAARGASAGDRRAPGVARLQHARGRGRDRARRT